MTNAVLAYMGPDVILPISSIGATILGFALIFARLWGRLVLGLCRAIIPGRRGPAPAAVDQAGRGRGDGPHHGFRGPSRVARVRGLQRPDEESSATS